MSAGFIEQYLSIGESRIEAVIAENGFNASNLTPEQNRDELTGLLTRAAFEQHVQDKLDALPDNKVLAVFALDMRRLKSLNDLYGHEIGDGAIQSTADSFTAIGRLFNFIQNSNDLYNLDEDQMAELIAEQVRLMKQERQVNDRRHANSTSYHGKDRRLNDRRHHNEDRLVVSRPHGDEFSIAVELDKETAEDTLYRLDIQLGKISININDLDVTVRRGHYVAQRGEKAADVIKNADDWCTLVGIEETNRIARSCGLAAVAIHELLNDLGKRSPFGNEVISEIREGATEEEIAVFTGGMLMLMSTSPETRARLGISVEEWSRIVNIGRYLTSLFPHKVTPAA